MGPNDIQYVLQICRERAVASLCVIFASTCNYGSWKTFWAGTEPPRGWGVLLLFFLLSNLLLTKWDGLDLNTIKGQRMLYISPFFQKTTVMHLDCVIFYQFFSATLKRWLKKRQEYSALKIFLGEGNLKCLETGICQTVTMPWAGLKRLFFSMTSFLSQDFCWVKSFLRSTTHEKCLVAYLLIEIFWKNTVNC